MSTTMFLLFVVITFGSIGSTIFLVWFYERQKKSLELANLVAQLTIAFVTVNVVVLAFLYLVLYRHTTPL